MVPIGGPLPLEEDTRLMLTLPTAVDKHEGAV